MATGAIEAVGSELITLDEFFDTLHPIQNLAHFTFLDFTRVNGHFEFVNLKMLKLTICLSICDTIGNLVTLMLNIRARKMDEAQRVLAVFSISFAMFTRGFTVLMKTKQIANLFNELDCVFPRTLDEQRRLKVAEELVSLKRRFAVLHKCITCAWIVFISVPFGQFLIFYDRDSNEPIPAEYHQHVSWKPFGVKQSYRAYPFCYLYESIVTILASTMIITYDQVFTIGVSQLCLQFNRLCEELTEMKAAETKDAVKATVFHEQFRNLMIKQQFLYNISDDLNKIFNLAILISDTVSAMSICFHIYLMTTENDIVVIIGFVGPCLIQIWLTYDVAKRGTNLEIACVRIIGFIFSCSQKTSGIKEALYGQAWYEGSMSYRKYVAMWMQYTNEPFQLTAFKLFVVNMEHFQDMMMLAYQLLTFLQSRGT